jgi:hypothetical protein
MAHDSRIHLPQPEFGYKFLLWFKAPASPALPGCGRAQAPVLAGPNGVLA